MLDVSELDLDLAQLDAAAAALSAREAALDARILTMREKSREAALANLPKMRAVSAALTTTREQLDALSKELSSAAAAATASSAALRTAHDDRERVMRARKMMDELLGLEECVREIEAALERTDYGAVIARVESLARAIEASEAQPPEGASPHKDERATEVVAALRKRVLEELEKAADGADIAAVSSLVRLTGPLRHADAGRAALKRFCLRLLDEAANEDGPSASEPPSATPGVPPAASVASAALGRLLQRCAALLEAAVGALDERVGGIDAQRSLANALRGRCVALGTALGSRLTTACSLRSASEEAARRLERAHMAPDEGLEAEGEKAGLACEPTLDWLVVVLRSVTQWDTYMTRHTGDGGGGGDGGSGGGAMGVSAAAVTLRHAPPFSEMARATVTLSHFWSHAAIGRAVRLSAAASSAAAAAETAATAVSASGGEGDIGGDGATSEVSQLVDSSFFLLQVRAPVAHAPPP